jgi:hypothetical protein
MKLMNGKKITIDPINEDLIFQITTGMLRL